MIHARLFLFALVLFFFSFVSHPLYAQSPIAVEGSDFADPGDTVRMSNAIWNPFLDFGFTGADVDWDFSSLIWQSQYVDTFLNVLFTHPVYSFTFSNLPLNPYRSNVAKRGENFLTGIPLLSNTFTNPYNFYYKTSASYRQKGIGMRVGGFPTAVPMTHPDTLYRFPMNYGDQDSSWSDFTVDIPQLGTYSHRQKRTNIVDGWGTLTTPYGTFEVLRMVTEIRGSDSLYVDTLQFGFKTDNDIIREYKWFGKDQKVPLLQINTQAGILNLFPNFEFVTGIVYRDSVRFLPTDVADNNEPPLAFQLFPNPTQNFFFVALPASAQQATLRMTDIQGKLVLEKKLETLIERVSTASLAKGIYIVTVQADKSGSSKKLVIE